VTQSAGTSDALDNQTITPTTRSILNRLTVDNFGNLSRELMECGISMRGHLEILSHEIMERATKQQHCINMYIDLCKILKQLTIEHGIGIGSKVMLQRILLNECQDCFERNFDPPGNMKDLTGEDLVEAEVKYTTSMTELSIFVGCLRDEDMFPKRVEISVMTTMRAMATQDALESLAAFLTTIAPTLDLHDLKQISELSNDLSGIFARIWKCLQSKDTPPRLSGLS